MAGKTKFTEMYKSMVGTTEKSQMEKCMQYVSLKGGASVNASGICKAVLEKSDSEDVVKEIDMFLQKLGISGAGPVPNSLLARQDLEGTKKARFEKTVSTCPYCGDVRPEPWAEAHKQSCPSRTKSTVEQTSKQLDRAVKQASEAEDTDEYESLAGKIKNIQIKRQKATIAERSREMTGKSFKQVWTGLNK